MYELVALAMGVEYQLTCLSQNLKLPDEFVIHPEKTLSARNQAAVKL